MRFTYRIPLAKRTGARRPSAGALPQYASAGLGVRRSTTPRQKSSRRRYTRCLILLRCCRPRCLQLGEWISTYYLAPIGEVFRSMLPLQAEVKRAWAYTLSESGAERLHAAAAQGSSRRSRLPPDEQMAEYGSARLSCRSARKRSEKALRSATGASRVAARTHGAEALDRPPRHHGSARCAQNRSPVATPPPRGARARSETECQPEPNP